MSTFVLYSFETNVLQKDHKVGLDSSLTNSNYKF